MEVVHLKAVYKAAPQLNSNKDGSQTEHYYSIIKKSIKMAGGSVMASNQEYVLQAEVRRINSYGYGVTKMQGGIPILRYSLRQTGSADETRDYLPLTQKDCEIVSVSLWRKSVSDAENMVMNGIKEMTLTVGHSSKPLCLATATTRSMNLALTNFSGWGTGFVWEAALAKLISQKNMKSSMSWICFRDMGLRANGTTVFKATTSMVKTRNRLVDLFAWAKAEGIPLESLTYYQIQWAIQKNENLGADEAYAACMETFNWLQNETEPTEEE